MFENLLLVAMILTVTLLIINRITSLILNKAEIMDMKDNLLANDELYKHARDVAANHTISKRIKDAPQLLDRLHNNYKIISETKSLFERDVNSEIDILPAAEWLLDNYYILHEICYELESSLAKGFKDELPVISTGSCKHFPRSYAIAVEILSHTDGEVDENIINTFLQGYQNVSILNMGELWSLQMMLKLASIEYIRQLCDKLKDSRQQRIKAEEAADFIVKNISTPFKTLQISFEERYQNDLKPSFVERLLFKLRMQNVKGSKILPILNSLLEKEGFEAESMVETDHGFQSWLQLAMGNLITTVRGLGTFDFSSVYKNISMVEQILNQDPSCVFPQMDDKTKILYRDKIKELAKRLGTTEIHIARTAVYCAREKNISPQNHVGYYILDRKGIEELYIKSEIKKKRNITDINSSHKGGYPTAIIVLSIFISLWVIRAGFGHNIARHEVLAVFSFIICFIPSMELATLIVNLIISKLVKPDILPKLELKSGIPPESPVMVIVPTLLSSRERTGDIVGQLRNAYLSNKLDNVYFTLVADFKDSATETIPSDTEIIEEAQRLLESLNKEYCGETGDRFFFIFRDRKFVQNQNKWMVWERKRGAVLELVRFLRGENNTGFESSARKLKGLPKIKYIITLDADTIMPLDAVRKLTGTMLHPLNRPFVDKARGVVTSGYGLVQPRIGINIKSSMASTYSMVYASNGGIDTYSGAVSDVYQDLFAEGSFTGKGIFDVDVYYEVLNNAIPENKVLSHDLLEGSFLRTGLATDIILLDSYPSKYNSASMRLHRWVRGDWQLIGYLRSYIYNTNGKKAKNPISVISKWKIFDNLRRSLLSPFLLLLLILAFTVLPYGDGKWIAFFIIVSFSPLVSYVFNRFFDGKMTFLREKNYARTMPGLAVAIIMSFLNIAFVAHHAYLMSDAIITTLWRVIVSKKNMLQWTTAADMEALLKNRLSTYWRFMWFSPAIGVALLCLSLVFTPDNVFFGVLLSVTFILAPMLAYYMSQPVEEDEDILEVEDIKLLRRIARKNWAFYEDFSGREDNYLPPDNHQEEPTIVTAHRTSPTNIGFLLLSYLGAKDLGYISATEMLELLDKTTGTLEKLDKWKGHLYNWYDTKTLSVLRPRYISTVDSGNLAGYIIVIISALKEREILIDNIEDLLRGLIDIATIYSEEEGNQKLNIDAFRTSDDEDFNKIKVGIDKLKSDISAVNNGYWFEKLNTHIERIESILNGKRDNKILEEKAENLKFRLKKLLDEMDFTVLYEPRRNLFSIGYNVEEGRITKTYYDLLASEARLASFIAISRGEVPAEHWFRLGRKLVRVDGYRGLVSWTGTMFEYLMPLLVMESYSGTLLSETYKFVLQNQVKYGALRNIPWGVSESGYNAFDVSLNYQYRAFGIPELALKRGMENDVVIAPYASMMAVMVEPCKAVENIRKLEGMKAYGRYGLFEAIDYTPQRIAGKENYSVVRSYMAHHQGMGLIAIVNVLKDNVMQKRFGRCPSIEAASILLQERMPEKTLFNRSHRVPALTKKTHHWEYREGVRKLTLENKAVPSIQLLCNGTYSIMVTDTGLGYGKMNEIALYRWSRDITSKKTGFFIFVQNMNSNEVWSATFEPLRTKPDEYNVIFAPDKAVFTRKDGNIETRTEITVSPEDNVEIRKVSLINHGEKAREIEVTSYMEVVVTSLGNDLAHPAFSNLFIRTEYSAEQDSLLASRRPRSEGQQTMWCFERALVSGEEVGRTTYETDRYKFIGRNRDITNPVALDVSQPLTNSQGAVIDPIFALRKRVIIQPGATAVICFAAGIGESREKVLRLSVKYGEYKNINRAFELSYTRSHIEADFLNLKPSEYIKYMKYAPLLMLFNQRRNKQAEFISKNTKGQSGLWPYGISGDIPIMAVKVTSLDELADLIFIIRAHEFYRHRGVFTDLVLLIEDPESGYIQPLYMGIKSILNATHLRDMLSKRGGVFILDINTVPEEDTNLLLGYAAFYIDDLKTSIESSLSQYFEKAGYETIFKPIPVGREVPISKNSETPLDLMYDNSFGGFSEDGREYVIYLEKGRSTPLPWINVISNKSFGFQISEAGGGCAWADNGRENKLSVWSNDPVTDPAGEVIYIKDYSENLIFTATPKPRGEADLFVIRHGIGYSIFEQKTDDLAQKMIVFACNEDKVKLSCVRLKNIGTKSKKLGLTYYVRPVLGVSDIQSMRGIVTRVNREDGYITAANGQNSDFPGKLLFVACSENIVSFTCDREEFLGIGGDLKEPRALLEGKFKEQSGAGVDPCIAYYVDIELQADEEKQLVFLLGQGESDDDIVKLLRKYAQPESALKELELVRDKWAQIINTINVSTPDKSMDIMLNSWLLYQTVSCRLWARAAFYQSGGAFGFRDQLQDVMALEYSMPEVVRKQILLHASRQFAEGDVQHWWHEQDGKGIRTRYSDDLLWLPYVTCDYINHTGDFAILDEMAGFVESPVLSQGEDERYEVPAVSAQKATIYEHCIRALELGIRRGPHGIPLMGGGDWNDGMNTVGNRGTGESVWLGWFLYEVLKRFVPVCKQKGDIQQADKYTKTAEEIVKSIEKEAWDGKWYMRAFFDDGTPLGSSRNTECTIDSLAQSWAAITGAGRKERVEEALNSLEKYLIDNETGIIKLLTPPFDKSNLHPGYIKSYLPGVRENGGQYTHAATWVVMAFAKMGRGERAVELYNMINPINHTRTKSECLRYKTEPYVMSADVYAVEPNVGRGGWSWYTGTAGWMYRVGIESILGIKKNKGRLVIDPCIPASWTEYTVKIREGASMYNIKITNPEGVCRGIKDITVDGMHTGVESILLADDGRDHFIEALMGNAEYEG